MSKTNDQLLKDYKKSNAVRRLAIIKKAGFSSASQYLDSLMSVTVQTAPLPITIHNVHIVDISSSMSGGKLTSAIQGINGELLELKSDKDVIYTQTLIEFNTNIRTVCYKTPIANAALYQSGAGGMTALNEAIGVTLTRLKDDISPEDKVLVKIFTDGGENVSSPEWRDKSRIAQLIKECENRGFTVTFVGTEFDVNEAVRSYGVDASNTLVHDNSAASVSMSFMATRGATEKYKSKLMRGEAVERGFYKTINE